MKHRRKSLGNATLEFTLVGIPLVFVLISTIEMARGMWIYHTLAFAVREGVRYTIVRGQNSLVHPTYADVCNTIVKAGPGLIPADLNLTFTTQVGVQKPDGKSASVSTGPYQANSCAGGTWPPLGLSNQPGQVVGISATYPFQSAIAMFWPGAGQSVSATQLTCNGPGTLCLPASSSEAMQY